MITQAKVMSHIQIQSMNDFPYDVNRRAGTYFLEGEQVDDKLLDGHYAVAYEGTDPRLCTWAWKRRKELPNIARYFEGATVQEKRQIIWQKFEAGTVDRHFINFCEKFRDKPLHLWYLSKQHDLPVAEFIKRFLEWYWSQYPLI